MRSNHIHTLFTNYIDPSIPINVVKRNNHAMDNPTPMDRMARQLFRAPQPPRIKGPRVRRSEFGPRKIGHRVYNHDWTDAVIQGFLTDGIDGVKARLLHNAGDMLRDTVVQSTGANMANLAEAALEFVLSQGKKKRLV